MAKKNNLLRTPRIKKRSPPGSAPGVVATKKEQRKASIRVSIYDHASFFEQKISSVDSLRSLIDSEKNIWIDVYGIEDQQLLQFGEIFDLHSLTLEDVQDNQQRPKVEGYDHYVYMVLKMIASVKSLKTDQLSIFLNRRILLTFHPFRKDCLDPVRERLRNGQRIRSLGVEYLAYAIIDSVIDNYFPVLERFADHLDAIEQSLFNHDSPVTVQKIHEVKGELLHLRRIIWAHRDMTHTLLRDRYAVFSKDTRMYLRDCYDNVLQQLDLVETYRDVCTNLMDLSFSLEDRKANEVMKVLTVVSSIFIPLTFISGIYGMNFDSEKSLWNMPELAWRYGYPFALGLMAVVAFGMVVFFRKKKWL